MPADHPPGDPGPDRAPPSVAFLLSRLGYQVQRDIASRLRPLGLEPRQFGLLRMLAQADGGSQRALGEILEISPNRMVALVDDLERKGLVQRRAHPTDRRAHALALTGEGSALLARAFDAALSLESEICEPLDASERAQLLGLLGRLVARDPGRPGVHPGLTDPESPC
jgi:DNA-binding MarR family transcriptional regulator